MRKLSKLQVSRVPRSSGGRPSNAHAEAESGEWLTSTPSKLRNDHHVVAHES